MLKEFKEFALRGNVMDLAIGVIIGAAFSKIVDSLVADIFIAPGYAFAATGALVTNFHLPRSTLLAMVMAFAGIDEVRRLYRTAVEERYRFYSFGDAMLIA